MKPADRRTQGDDWRARSRRVGRHHFSRAAHFPGFREEMAEPLLVDMAIHYFDAVRYLLDRDPVAVYCETHNPTWSWYAGNANACAVFEMEGGIRFLYDGSWCSPGAETSWNGSRRVSGKHGTALWHGDDAPTLVGVFAHDLDAPDVGLEIDGALREFVSALRTGRTPSGEVHENVMSLAMVEAAVESSRTGRRILLENVLQAAYETALRDEPRADVRAQARRLAVGTPHGLRGSEVGAPTPISLPTSEVGSGVPPWSA